MGDADDGLRGDFIAWAVAIGQVSTLALTWVYWWLGSPEDVALSLAAHLSGWVMFGVWKVTRSPPVAASVMAVLLVAVFVGGVVMTHSRAYLAWIALVPVAVLFLGGWRRQRWILLVAGAAALATAVRLATLDSDVREVGSHAVRTLRAGSLVPTLFFLALAYERVRSTALAAARAAHAEAVLSQEGQTRFLAKVSHELRTPLNGIVGMAEALRSELASEQGHRDLTTLQRSAGAMLALVNDLIDVARAASGEFTVAAGAVELEGLLRDVVALHGAAASAKRLPVRLVAPGVPLWVETDGNRLRQVLGNLVGNAVKFTDTGEVEVRLSTAPAATGVNVTVSVRDTGPGIPGPEQARLFKPFEQLSTARGRGGSGLGLAISREIISRMGGSLSLVSGGPGGSVFQIDLWCMAARPTVPEQVDPAPTALSGRVLVVDDNEINRTVASRLLAKLGLVPVTASSGEEALHHALDPDLVLVLMDLQMPGLDGLAAARQLKARGLRCPIVALTASATEGTRASCLEAGMADCLLKPINFGELAEVLARVGT